jgi:hypothetical protein
LGKRRFEELSDAMGEGGLAAMLVAKEHGTPLYADDLGLCYLARNEEGVEGVWTQPVLLLMRERNALSADEYHDALRKLTLVNYYFPLFTPEDMKWILRRNSFGLTGEVTRMVGFLQGAECDERAAVVIMGELIRYVWLHSTLNHQRWLFLDFALNTLTSGREGGSVLAKLKQIVRVKFRLLPIDLPRILHSIDAWERQSAGRLWAA